jgi:hypothetical protein
VQWDILGVSKSTAGASYEQVLRRTWDIPLRLPRKLRHDLRPNRRGRQHRHDAGQPTVFGTLESPSGHQRGATLVQDSPLLLELPIIVSSKLTFRRSRPMPYKVIVDDNSHYQDESERYVLSEFPTLDAAVEASRKIVDEYLLSAYQPGVTAEALFRSYTSFGEDPWIVAPTPEETVRFSAWDYAKRRCDEVCLPVKGSDG